VDAPLPLPVYLLGAGLAVAASFALVAISDTGTTKATARAPSRAPATGPLRTLPRWSRLGLRAGGLLAWGWVVAQAIAGGSSSAEVASLILWVFGWVGLALVSALIGPAWSWLDPFSTLADLAAGLRHRVGMRRAAVARWPRRSEAWPAVAFMVLFVWLELAARVESGRGLGLVLIGYSVASLIGAALFGRARWRRRGEVFSVWFGLLGRLAPFGRVGPPSRGRVRRRGFGSALATSPWPTSLLALVSVAVGAVIWDGVSQTQPYLDVVGQTDLLADTLMLLAFLAILTWLVLLVARRVGAPATGAGLVPVATGYLVAHYLGFLLIDGQRIVVALSDPFQQGWDLFGTAHWQPQGAWLGGSVLWTMQVLAVVIGHVVGAWLGHSAARQEPAEGQGVRQWPLAALMICLTVLTLWSLGQNLVFVSGSGAP